MPLLIISLYLRMYLGIGAELFMNCYCKAFEHTWHTWNSLLVDFFPSECLSMSAAKDLTIFAGFCFQFIFFSSTKLLLDYKKENPHTVHWAKPSLFKCILILSTSKPGLVWCVNQAISSPTPFFFAVFLLLPCSTGRWNLRTATCFSCNNTNPVLLALVWFLTPLERYIN